MELHLVHFKTEYGTPQAAMNHTDGLAVLAVLFTKESDDNPALDPLVENLDKVINEGGIGILFF